VGVIIEARHLCMQMRGVEKQHGQAGFTSAMLGAFRENKQTRDEFFGLGWGRGAESEVGLAPRPGPWLTAASARDYLRW